MQKRWFFILVAVISVLGTLAFVRAQGTGDGATPSQDAAELIGPEGQPIAFPHNRHAGEYQIDCQYCHYSAERSRSAGIPPVATCMGCHTQIQGSERPEEVAKLVGYWERAEAIPWNRVYKVADHVYFPHMRHVSAGVDCASCHGSVEEIGVIQKVNQPLTMGWCLNCHIDMGATRDCTACHY
jgi:hypothetical protein